MPQICGVKIFSLFGTHTHGGLQSVKQLPEQRVSSRFSRHQTIQSAEPSADANHKFSIHLVYINVSWALWSYPSGHDILATPSAVVQPAPYEVVHGKVLSTVTIILKGLNVDSIIGKDCIRREAAHE